MEKKFGVRVAAGHINYLLRKRGLKNRTRLPKSRVQMEVDPAQPEFSEPVTENAGLFSLEAAKGEHTLFGSPMATIRVEYGH